MKIKHKEPYKMKKTETGWRLYIRDKVEIPNAKCPSHRLPHKLPFQKPVTNESCHYHNHKWRMCHHVPFCWLFCKHYKKMMRVYRLRKQKNDIQHF